MSPAKLSPMERTLVPVATQRRWIFSAASRTPNFSRHLPPGLTLPEVRFDQLLTLKEDDLLRHLMAHGWPKGTTQTIHRLPGPNELTTLPRYLIFDADAAQCHRLYLNVNDIEPPMRSLVFATEHNLFAYIVRDLMFSLRSRWMDEWRKASIPADTPKNRACFGRSP